jgi:hypothetical protein
VRFGEAAGAIVLELADSARKRGVPALAAIAGCAKSDGVALAPLRLPEPERIAATERRACAKAGIDPTAPRRIERDLLFDRIGWCPADGVLRVIAGVALLEASAAPALISGAARGGGVAAIALAPAGRS